MFELNLASLPNHILYLKGVQLSYIKVFVHIFNLWQSDKPCYIKNTEFCRRTGLCRETVSNAITFFETNKILKRITKRGKRYLIQIAATIEISSEEECSNNAKGAELDHKGCGVRPHKGAELDHLYIRKNKEVNNKRERPQKTLSVDNYKTKEAIKLCSDKNLNIDNELRRFKNYYGYSENKTTVGKFLNWLENARPESKGSTKQDITDYIKRYMRDCKCSEEEAKEYYRNRGYSV